MNNMEIVKQKLNSVKEKIDKHNYTINCMNKENEKLRSEIKKLEKEYNTMLEEENIKNIMEENIKEDKNNVVFIKLDFELYNSSGDYEAILSSCEVYNNIKDAMNNEINWKTPGHNLNEDIFPVQKDVLFIRRSSYESWMILKKYL